MWPHLFPRKHPAVTSITIEHGVIKILIARGREVLDHRVLLANPRFFREGLVSDPGRVATIIQNSLGEMNRNGQWAIAAVPGFQNTLRHMELPQSRGLDPAVIIPREAGRSMGISLATYNLTWHRLPDRLNRTRWLVVSAARRSITSLQEPLQKAGLRVRALDLRPFALARAINQTEATIAWLSSDGCDVVVVRDSVPVEHQSLFWGAEPVEGAVLVERLTDIVERTIAEYNQRNPEEYLPDDTPLYLCGSPVSLEPDIALQLAANLRRSPGQLAPPMSYPEEFPVNDLIINIGLTLREA